MNSKLTLNFNKSAIEKAKLHTPKKTRNLLSVVKNYFQIIADKYDKEKIEISPTC